MNQLIDHLEQLAHAQHGGSLPDDYELVVHVAFDNSGSEKRILWKYYFVDHRTRSLFWLRSFEVGLHLYAVFGDVRPAHFSVYTSANPPKSADHPLRTHARVLVLVCVFVFSIHHE